MRKLNIIILAAGQGTRMKSPEIPKVLVKLKNKPLLEYVIDESEKLNFEKCVVIVGHKKEKIYNFIKEKNYSGVETAIQAEQLGTGHAVNMAKNNLSSEKDSDTLILCGDVPLLSSETLNNFINNHNNEKSDLSVLSTFAPDPAGYGRIIRDSEGSFQKIVEHKDATENEKLVSEINSGVYLVDTSLLFESLENISSDNAQGEYYLTDIVEIAKKKNKNVNAYPTYNYNELQGINSPENLKEAEKTLDLLERPFKILGLQQIAIGGESKVDHLNLWNDIFGIKTVGNFVSKSENVNEDILSLGSGIAKVEIDIMEPLDINKKPAVHSPPLNHIGLWIDDLDSAYKWMQNKGVRFTPGGIRKGASGHNVCFIHPKENEEYNISGNGILIELVQAPEELINQFNRGQ